SPNPPAPINVPRASNAAWRYSPLATSLAVAMAPVTTEMAPRMGEATSPTPGMGNTKRAAVPATAEMSPAWSTIVFHRSPMAPEVEEPGLGVGVLPGEAQRRERRRSIPHGPPVGVVVEAADDLAGGVGDCPHTAEPVGVEEQRGPADLLEGRPVRCVHKRLRR